MFGLRKAEAIRDTPEGDFILSLIPYGLFRRAALGKLAKEAMGFSPKYELIIHRPGRTLDPICTFHFADRQTAETMYHRIAQTLIQDGVYGNLFPKMIRDAGPRGIDARWMPNLKPIAESEIEEITDLEEKEFSDRLAKYVTQQSKKSGGVQGTKLKPLKYPMPGKEPPYPEEVKEALSKMPDPPAIVPFYIWPFALAAYFKNRREAKERARREGRD